MCKLLEQLLVIVVQPSETSYPVIWDNQTRQLYYPLDFKIIITYILHHMCNKVIDVIYPFNILESYHHVSAFFFTQIFTEGISGTGHIFLTMCYVS